MLQTFSLDFKLFENSLQEQIENKNKMTDGKILNHMPMHEQLKKKKLKVKRNKKN